MQLMKIWFSNLMRFNLNQADLIMISIWINRRPLQNQQHK